MDSRDPQFIQKVDALIRALRGIEPMDAWPLLPREPLVTQTGHLASELLKMIAAQDYRGLVSRFVGVGSRTRDWRRPRSDWLYLAAWNARLKRAPELAAFVACSHNGYVRQIAVRHLGRGLSEPFEVLALFWRLNDWVAPVRQEARDALARVMNETAPAVLIAALAPTLARMDNWGRWRDVRDVVDNWFSRAEVGAAVVERLSRGGSPGDSRLWEALIEHPASDSLLPEIAMGRASAPIRARTVQTILTGQARWLDRRAPYLGCDVYTGRIRIRYESRTIDPAVRAAFLTAPGLAALAADRSASVRLAVLDSLERRKPPANLARSTAASLVQDRSSRVRARADWIVRATQSGRWPEGGDPDWDGA